MMAVNERTPWTHDDDLQLVEAVLRNVRKGNTVIDGVREFSEASNGIRSIDSSKFRFHTKLKDQYYKAYELAKKEGRAHRNRKKKRVTQDERFDYTIANLKKVDDTEKVEHEIMIEDVQVLLKKYIEQENAKSKTSDHEEELNKLRRENERLTKQVNDLKDSNVKLNKAFNEIEDDYKELKQAVSILKNVGLNIDVPAPKSATKYVVGKDGLIQTIE